jgi:Sulfotransferase family
MTRFLQGAFPAARFVMVVRHPAIVSLSTRKRARLRPLGALLDHWFTAHRLFEEDAAFLHRLLVVKYEHLVADPERTLAELAAFLELDGDIPADGIDTRRSASYERQWAELAGGGRWRRERFRALCRRHEPAANHVGYSLLDLDRCDPFPVGSPRP